MHPRLLTPFLLTAFLCLSVGCGARKVHRLTDERFERVADPAAVRLFAGPSERPHTRIAYVNSTVAPDRTVETKRQQLEELQEYAAKLGADAIVEVQLLEERHKGFISDPTTPFKAWRQGRQTLYFLRGVAVRYLPEGEVPASEEAVAAEAAMMDSPFGDLLAEEGYGFGASSRSQSAEDTLTDDYLDLDAIPEAALSPSEPPVKGRLLTPPY